MLDHIFLQILDMTAMGSLVIGIVLLARLCLKKQPKIYSYCLWAVVLLRLLCPWQITASVSVLPAMPSMENNYALSNKPLKPEHVGTALEDTFQSAVSGQLGQQQTIIIQNPDHILEKPQTVHYDWWNILVFLGQYLWLLGVAVMLTVSMIQLLRLKMKLREAVRLEGIVYICDGIDTAFVTGLLWPKIYLPAALTEQEQHYILLHEQHHIRRFDPVFKALGYLALCLHWFNPLVWVAFILAGRDMEMSCDEAVLKKTDGDIRADYAATLLRLSTGRTIIAGAPLAFGEGDAGKRIRNLSKWKKPALWAGILAAVCCAAVIVLCLFSRPQRTEMIFDREIAPGHAGQTFSMPEYPGVTFKLVGYAEHPDTITRVIAKENGREIIITDGMPIDNLYLCDLNADGKRELCTTVSYGSGIVDSHVEVFDYDKLLSYGLWERMEYNYWLTMEDGALTVHRYPDAYFNPNASQQEQVGTMSLFLQQLRYTCNWALPDSGPAEMIFDQDLHPAKDGQVFTMPEFPGVTFRLSQEKNSSALFVIATKNGQDTPILHAWKGLYLADLNGDGKRELCGVDSMGSGYCSQYIAVVDYAAGKGYQLHDRMQWDYDLRIENRRLVLDRYKAGGAPPHVTGDQPESSGKLVLGQALAYSDGKSTTIHGRRLTPQINESALTQIFQDAKQQLTPYNPEHDSRSISETSAIMRYLEAYDHVIGDAVSPDGLSSSFNPHYTLSLNKAQHDEAVFQYLLVLSNLQATAYGWYTPFVYYDYDKPDQLFVCSEFWALGYRDIESYYADVVNGKCKPVYDTFVISLNSHNIHYWGSNTNLYNTLVG